ncbi:MAG: AAA family ATPase [Campylobacteraceae bacterium]|nr:AAA family ATPase [Campylobacteraceae bacterium]
MQTEDLLNKVIKTLEESHLFLTGGGGVGKSYITNKVMEHFRANGKNVVALGSTGVSAVNIGGITLHAFFGFGICKNQQELKEYDRSRRAKEKLASLAEILSKTELLIIDEISMVSSELFLMIYERLFKLNFGGKIMVVGDFYQLPPIVKDEKNDLFTNKYAFSSHAWELLNFTNIEFIKSKRTTDLEFYRVLSLIRVGRVDEKITSYLKQFLTSSNSLDSDMTTLFGRNKEADALNSLMLSRIDANLETFEGYTEMNVKGVHPEKVDKWIKNLNVAPVFEFKVGARVLFTMNKYSLDRNDMEFYNGEKGVIVEVKKDEFGFVTSVFIEKEDSDVVEVLPNGYEMGEFVALGDEVKYEVMATFYQFPLRLAYGITIHKSQGMSIENLTCNLDNIFAEGQLYVALSRATNPKSLKIVYTRYEPFERYIQRVVKTNKAVDEFYQNESFIYYE